MMRHYWSKGLALAAVIACITAPAHGSQHRAAIHYTYAKSEPVNGCYFSVFVGPDKSIRTEMFKRGGALEDALGRIVHKNIAVEWKYFYYDDPQELQGFLRIYKKFAFTMEVALEPRNGLQEVNDNEYLRSLARIMAGYGRPIFLRFASEMNGNWTPYHETPALYRKKFRIVHDVMAKYAPNVVMIWCVSATPKETIDRYYPGDKYVDWVGVDFYSVLHHNGDIKQPARDEHPAAMLDNVYRKYSARKPICICEYAATHAEKIRPGVDESAWASAKLAELLGALPRRYPRVKMIGLYNVNTMMDGFDSASAKLNNFCFTDSPTMALSLSRSLASGYYLSKVVDAPSVRTPYK